MTFRMTTRKAATARSVRHSTRAAALLIAAGLGLSAQAQEPAGDAPLGAAAVPAALSDARASVERAWDAAPLGFETATFVQEPARNYGVYTPRAGNAFETGEPLVVYVEPIGYGYGEVDGKFEIAFDAGFELRTPDGQILASREGFATLTLASRNRNREYQASLTYTFDGLAAGDYILRTTLSDRNSNKRGSFSLPFSIKQEAAAQ